MSMTESALVRTGVRVKNKSLGIAAAVLLAGLVVAIVARFFPPLTEGERAEVMIDATSGLPQDR